jgi:dTMP kinase
MVREILVNHEMEPTTELLLYNGSRHEFVVKVVLPALEQYDYVITDRYYDSTTAYQGYGRGLELGPIRQIIGIAVDNLVPARTYLLDVDPEIGLVRATKPGVETNKFEAETMEFHQKVAEGYLDMASQEPERFTVIDANQEADAVFEDIFADFVEHFQITRGETR